MYNACKKWELHNVCKGKERSKQRARCTTRASKGDIIARRAQEKGGMHNACEEEEKTIRVRGGRKKPIRRAWARTTRARRKGKGMHNTCQEKKGQGRAQHVHREQACTTRARRKGKGAHDTCTEKNQGRCTTRAVKGDMHNACKEKERTG